MLAATATRKATDDDGLGEAPWYVRAAVRFGVPTVAAVAVTMFVINLLATDVRETLRKEAAALDAHVQAQAAAQMRNDGASQANKDAIESVARQLETQGQLLQLICYNGARDEASKRGCLAVSLGSRK